MLTLPYGLDSWITVALEAAAGGSFQANPTLASGDVTISIDNGSSGNLATLPTVTPASGKFVLVKIAAAETLCSQGEILFQDASGAEWLPLAIPFTTVPAPLLGIESQGTAAGGGAGYIDLASGGVTADDEHNGKLIQIIGGTGKGQLGVISDSANTNDRCNVTAYQTGSWASNADNTSVYRLYRKGVDLTTLVDANVTSIDDSTGAATKLKNSISSVSNVFTVAAGSTASIVKTDAMAADGFYSTGLGRLLVVLTGTYAGQVAAINAYYQTNGAFHLTNGLTGAPAEGDTVLVL